MQMDKIQPKDSRYIKLGQGGKFEYGCIEHNDTIRLDYRNVPHDLCHVGKWNEVREFLIEKQDSEPGAATRHRDQIKDFYELDAEVLWVTFYKNMLWWCHAQPKVILLNDGTKERKTVAGWSNTDIKAKPLYMSELNGQLTSMQGFRGTICRVKLHDYLVRKINGQKIQEEQAALKAQQALIKALVAIIRSLPWKEFELLIDLIFRQAGWQRLSQLGRTQKTIDLDLLSPITNDRYLVQIKSRATRKQFEQFQQNTEGLSEYSRCYFVVHTPQGGLTTSPETDLHKLWFAEDIAQLVVQYGLTDWVIAKAI